MKHAPGPWSQATHSQTDIVSNDETMIAFVREGMNGLTREQAIVNARLIASAPDLLAALESALPALIRLGDFVGNVDLGGASNQGRIDRCALILQARAAIARATGEQ